jgi:Uma2 family endonuclease
MAEKATDVKAETIAVPEVSFEEYLARYAADFYEWEGGRLIKMTPIHERHDALTTYLRVLLETYLVLQTIGMVRGAPFTMKLETAPSGREPDLQVILEGNPHYTPTGMFGPADLCIEVVSLESIERDHGTKLEEYEKGGVREYWIIDSLRREARFLRLDEESGRYIAYREGAEGNYQTPLLPRLRLHVPTLWRDPLPNPLMVAEGVKAMMGES